MDTLSKLIRLGTLDVCISLYVNYSSIKRKEKKLGKKLSPENVLKFSSKTHNLHCSRSIAI